jgi:hypothetical protein
MLDHLQTVLRESLLTWERFETEAINDIQRGVFDVHMVLDSNSTPAGL